MQLQINIGQDEFSLKRKEDNIFLNEQPQNYTIRKVKADHFLMYRSNKVYEIKLLHQENNQQLTLNINGHSLEVGIKDHITQILEKLGMDVSATEVIEGINAPMPGSILEIAVKEGDQVKKGDKLIILEAMKMENVIKSPIDGQISRINVSTGENVEKNQPLMSF